MDRKIKIKPGKYILAVSGGVDSMSLLDILSKREKLEIVIAHYNHGIRPTAAKDEHLVRRVAEQKNFKLEVGQGELGPHASEEKARHARYEFLEKVRYQNQAQAIIAAHHQDDLVETAFLNLLRGTNRLGLSSMSNPLVIRPMLSVPKAQIIKYAQANGLEWIEDQTNQDNKHLRNRVRRGLMTALSTKERTAITGNLEKVADINQKINKQIATLSHQLISKNEINRHQLINLPQSIAKELIANWLREYGVREFDQKTIDRLYISLKTGLPGSEQPAKKGLKLKIGQKTAHFTTTD